MNQEKIGKFILKLRLEKNMTQQELAHKLGVTDRAISKWENGRGLPDLSLIKPLCDELNITVNDFISAERVDKEKYQEKFEENILNTIEYSNKKNKGLIKFIVIILIFIILLISMFLIDVNKMRNNEQVIFSTWGFKYSPTINLNETFINETIKKYLINNDSNELHNNSKKFVSMRVYLLEEKVKNEKYYVYAWVRESTYYLDNQKLIEDSSSSIPYKFVVIKENDEFYVDDSRIPRDGSYYYNDMKNIFPKSVRDDMENIHNDGTIEKLNIDILNQAKLYFHI